MKNRITVLLAALVMAVSFTACDDYEDGPSMSFHTKKERVSNHWKYQYLLENGRDVTLRVDKTTVEFLNNGTFTINNEEADTLAQITGYWTFLSDEEQIFMHYVQPLMADDRDTFEILKLKEKELWLRWTHDTITQELQFIPK